MADRSQPHQVQVHTTITHHYEGDANLPTQCYKYGGVRSRFSFERGLSAFQILTVLPGVPIGSTLLFLTNLSLINSFTRLVVTTLLFILFSLVMVLAAININFAVAGILTSRACGLTGLMSFSWVINYIQQSQGTMPEQLDLVKQCMIDMAS